ncbi:hypothetical protein SAMN04489798_4389 [Pseudomonas arsenicoxydans]|uniref:Uncharacterized protein n=1 Tax=Pseudomonas arsenicoxydans TaxID=702115 RepID=A0A1H0P1T6_9PSED|nr:hypothetical protein [Pseudomonas arsenicoxydans]SDO98962.1 hypothetical protein SAMN04489798_4389 [Pseudomonas arsenicoxydans]
MANDITRLHSSFIEFAKGMPSVGISWQLVNRDVQALLKTLSGVNPNSPSAYMGNIEMPVYQLAYSVFVDTLTVSPTGSGASLYTKLTANIHPLGRPGEVIRSYEIETSNHAKLSLGLDEATNEVFWRQQGGVIPRITPSWGPDADNILSSTTIPAPQKDNYLAEVEAQIIWMTGPTFVSLVAGVLPRYQLTEIIPWLRFSAPLVVSIEPSHILITAPRARMTIGDCMPETIDIIPDPAFPYGEAIPTAIVNSDDIDLAVYAPRTRLLSFFADKIKPAIMVSDSGGGVIKWSANGSIGLTSLEVDITTSRSLSGVIIVKAVIDFHADARAWIDGPCGTKASLASANVDGQGQFEADIKIDVDLNLRIIEATLVISRSDLTVDWDINTPLGWPINEIGGEILNRMSKDEVRKLNGKVIKLGRWDILGLPISYLDSLGNYYSPIPVNEGLSKVSAMFGVVRKNVGRRRP